MKTKRKTLYVEDKITEQVSLSGNCQEDDYSFHQDLGQAGCLSPGGGGLREPGRYILGFCPALFWAHWDGAKAV